MRTQKMSIEQVPNHSDDLQKPILSHLVVCDSVAQGPDGKATLYGLFNRIVVEKVPTAHSDMTLFMTFAYGRAGKYSIRFEISAPSKKIALNSPPINFELQDDKAVHNVNIRFQGFPLPEEGPYRIAIFFGKEEFPIEDKLLFFVEKKGS